MEMKPIARRHHYLPQAYLAAFTETGSKDDQFFVFDINSGHHFCTSPINVAVEKDFNRVDIKGMAIDAIEQMLSPLEDQAAMAIRNVIKNEKFPNEKDFQSILKLLGLIAVRNPQLRKSFNHSREQVFFRVGDILVFNKKIWEHYLKKAKDSGENINDDVPFEKIKQFVKERKYRIEFSPASNLRLEFRTFPKRLKSLGRRTWSVLVAPNDGPEFICSDHPVTLVWKNGNGEPVGYGLQETEVFFPLSQRVGFYGVFEAPFKSMVKLEPEQVAIMNWRVAMNADRHIFSAKESFFLWHDGQIKEVQCGPSKANSADSKNGWLISNGVHKKDIIG